MIAWAKKHPARFFLSLILLLQVSMLVTAGTLRGEYLSSYDGIAYYVWLRSPVVDGDFNFNNDYMLYNPDGKAPDPNIVYATTGKTYNHFSAGMPFLCSPGFLIGQGLSYVFGAETNGFGRLPQLGYVLNSFAYYAIGLLLLYAFMAKRVHWKLSLWICLFVAFGSTAGYYAWNEPYFVHSVEFFMAVMILYWVFDLRELNHKELFKGALLFALAAWLRLDMILFLLPALSRFVTQKECVKKLAIFGAYGLLFYCPHLLLRYHVSGIFKLVGGYSTDTNVVGGVGLTNLTQPHFDLVLLSPNNGYLFWCPLFALAFMGLFTLFRQDKKLFVLCVLIKLYLISSWDAWDGSASMGPRTLNSLIPFMCVSIALFVSLRSQWMKYFPLCVMLSCVWFTGLVFQRLTNQLPYYEGRTQVNKKIISQPLSQHPFLRVVQFQFTNLQYLLKPKEALQMMDNN